MPQCLVRGLRSIELVATNLDEAARFYETVWGLTPVEQRNDAQYFRGTGAITTSSACIAARSPRWCASCSTSPTGKRSMRCTRR